MIELHPIESSVSNAKMLMHRFSRKLKPLSERNHATNYKLETRNEKRETILHKSFVIYRAYLQIQVLCE